MSQAVGCDIVEQIREEAKWVGRQVMGMCKCPCSQQQRGTGVGCPCTIQAGDAAVAGREGVGKRRGSLSRGRLGCGCWKGSYVGWLEAPSPVPEESPPRPSHLHPCQQRLLLGWLTLGMPQAALSTLLSGWHLCAAFRESTICPLSLCPLLKCSWVMATADPWMGATALAGSALGRESV